MSIESLEHMVRSRVRMFLRHTWLVAILGTILIGAMIWAGFYYAKERDHLRVAASPLDARFVQVISDQIAAEHRDLNLRLVATDSTQGTAEAMSKGQADLAILPSDLDDSVNWPVVAILRQNVMALIVPAPGAASKAKPEETAAAKPAKSGKSKSDKKAAKGKKAAKAAKRTTIATPATTAIRRATASSAKSPISPASASASSKAMKRPAAFSSLY